MTCGGKCCGLNDASSEAPFPQRNVGVVDNHCESTTPPSISSSSTDETGRLTLSDTDRMEPAVTSHHGRDRASRTRRAEPSSIPLEAPTGTIRPDDGNSPIVDLAAATSSATTINPNLDNYYSSRTLPETIEITRASTTTIGVSNSFRNATAKLCDAQDNVDYNCSSVSATLDNNDINTSFRCAPTAEATGCKGETNGTSTVSCEDECCVAEEDLENDGCGEENSACPSRCCGKVDKPGNNSGCCGPENIAPDDCCTKTKEVAVVDTTEVTYSDAIDVEKGIFSKDHVVLSISGMTCTGCETKLKRTLGTLSYVSNLKTSLVLARAELDITQGVATADDVVKHLQRTTEFRCERVSSQGSTLDLICSTEPTAIVKGVWPDGVLEVTQTGKDLIRVAFDAKIVGARKLLERGWAQPLRLAPPRLDSTLDAGSKHVRHMGLMTLLSAILTIPVLIMAWAPLPERQTAYGSASLALATIVQVVIAGPFYPKAVKALVFSKVIEMDLLIVLSTSAAYVFSVVSFAYTVSGNQLSTGEFFETSTLLVTLIMVGRWVASLARQKAAESISVRALQAQTAMLVVSDDEEAEIDARLLQYGDIFKVSPDSRIPTDGYIISGVSEIDESMLTGESTPVEKHPGSSVIAGSINGLGMLTVRLTRLPGDNTITTIACMVDEAKLSKPRIQDIAEKVASYFVPVVVALTIITFTIWVSIGVAVRNQSGSQATIEAITYAITVLIVSCPCAIGLAVPMVIVVASGVAARRGVIFKSASSIEVAYKATDVIFDKTGTLTLGKLTVVDEAYIGDDSESAKALLLGMVKGIKHPVSMAVVAHLDAQKVIGSAVCDANAVIGKGVEGKFDGRILRAGNSRWLGASSHPAVQSMLSKGLTVFCFAVDNTLITVLGLQDTLRPDAVSTVASLQEAGINVHILSGDDDGAVRAVAEQLSIAEHTIRSRCSPRDKQMYVQDILASQLRSQNGKTRKPVVVFVGDGTNDAVALAQATVGVHVSSGADIAVGCAVAADVFLVRPDLSCVLTLITVSRKAMHRIAFNFGWSFVYNTFAVLLGGGAFVNARIPPEYAGLGELVSVLPVILAAVLLRWSRI